MLLLIAGLALWVFAHLFKRLAPNLRAALGSKGALVIAVALLISLVLIIVGYRTAPLIVIWSPPSFLIHVNNLMMVVAVALFGMAHTKGRMRGRLRHPMLGAVKLWAVAHLLVNGDLASIILFGVLLGWAIVSVIIINRSSEWNRPEPGSASRDWIFVVITVVSFAVIVGIHSALGVSPFPMGG